MSAIEFYRGTRAEPESVLAPGPSVWPYQLDHRRQRGKWTPVLEPSIPVVLHGPLNWCTVPAALLDTGADRSNVPYEWAAPLGVDVDRAESLTAWGNGILSEYLAPGEALRLEIAGRVIDLAAMFGPWDSLILGRDVLAHFRATFDERARVVILDPYDPA